MAQRPPPHAPKKIGIMCLMMLLKLYVVKTVLSVGFAYSKNGARIYVVPVCLERNMLSEGQRLTDGSKCSFDSGMQYSNTSSPTAVSCSASRFRAPLHAPIQLASPIADICSLDMPPTGRLRSAF